MTAAALIALVLLAPPVRVRGTVTRQGVYRAPHVKTAPNTTKADNYGTRGNVNPYTGKAGRSNP